MTGAFCRLFLRQQCLSCRLFVFHGGDFTLAGLDIERVVPLGNGDGADAVTDQVGNGSRFVEEPVNAQEQNQAYQGNGVDGCERCSQRYEARARHASRAF